MSGLRAGLLLIIFFVTLACADKATVKNTPPGSDPNTETIEKPKPYSLCGDIVYAKVDKPGNMDISQDYEVAYQLIKGRMDTARQLLNEMRKNNKLSNDQIIEIEANIELCNPDGVAAIIKDSKMLLN